MTYDRSRNHRARHWQCALTLVLAAASSAALAWYQPGPSIAQIEVVDRTDGQVLPLHRKDGQSWIVGTPGHEYAIRVRNLGPARILAVTSVDGVNVISGETASPAQSGYVLDGHGFVEIGGWRKSVERTAAFYFTDLADSYAARTGRPDNVGVIGIALFRERPRPIALRPAEPKIADRAGADAPASAAAAPSSAAPLPHAEASASDKARRIAPAPTPTLGTGHGRIESSHVQVVRFERETAMPAETITIRYDRRENLVAMGVLPPPAVAQSPSAFPGWMSFTPDPPRP